MSHPLHAIEGLLRARPALSGATRWLILLTLVQWVRADIPPLDSAGSVAISTLTYEGRLWLEGHFERPGALRDYRSRETFLTDGQAVRLDWTVWEDGDTVMVPESFLWRAGRLLHRDAPDQAWQEWTGRRAQQALVQVVGGLPETWSRVVESSTGALALTLEKGRPFCLTWPQAHPSLGDVGDSTKIDYDADALPLHLDEVVVHRDSSWRQRLTRVAWSTEEVAESLLTIPHEARVASEEPEADYSAPAELVQRAAGVWSVELPDIDSRSLILEFADQLVLIEVALASANGERILAAARQKWPDKPIGKVLFSHHHPHYTGGLRPFIATGATIYTTQGNEAFVRSVAARRFTLEPDRLARSPRPLALETFSGRLELADSSNALVAFDYGKLSQHTDEFVVFWLPRQQLLFQTELGWVQRDGVLRPLRRAAGLLAWLDAEHLDVRRLLQSYPMRDQQAMVGLSELDSLARPK